MVSLAKAVIHKILNPTGGVNSDAVKRGQELYERVKSDGKKPSWAIETLSEEFDDVDGIEATSIIMAIMEREGEIDVKFTS